MKLAIRVDANSLSGFGHFSRCVNLCRTWQNTGTLKKISFIGNYNAFALQVLEHYKLPYHFVQIENYTLLYEDILTQFDAVVFDSYLITQETLSRIIQLPIKSILLDDECLWNYSNIHAVVNFRSDAEKLYRYNSKSSFLGIEYFVVKPELVELRQKNVKKTDRIIKNILIFLGGSFSNEQFIHDIICEINRNFPQIKIILIGPSLKQDGEIIYTHQKPSFEIEKALMQADAVINGGGIIKYEASYSLIPTASFSTTKLQHEDSKILSQYGLHQDLGLILDISTKNIQEKLVSFIQNEELRKNLILSSTEYYPNNPTEKLVKNLISIL